MNDVHLCGYDADGEPVYMPVPHECKIYRLPTQYERDEAGERYIRIASNAPGVVGGLGLLTVICMATSHITDLWWTGVAVGAAALVVCVKMWRQERRGR